MTKPTPDRLIVTSPLVCGGFVLISYWLWRLNSAHRMFVGAWGIACLGAAMVVAPIDARLRTLSVALRVFGGLVLITAIVGISIFAYIAYRGI